MYPPEGLGWVTDGLGELDAAFAGVVAATGGFTVAPGDDEHPVSSNPTTTMLVKTPILCNVRSHLLFDCSNYIAYSTGVQISVGQAILRDHR